MLNSHAFSIKFHPATTSPLFFIENEVDTDHLDNFEACGCISVGVCRSQLPVSTLEMLREYY